METTLTRRFSILVLAVVLIGGPAFAQQGVTCGDREFVTAKLEAKYGEIQQGAGLVSADKVLELWSSAEGSWTILMTRSDGLTCIMAAGNYWRDRQNGAGDNPA